MLCPIDGETLLITSREGVEIDYCPACRGVWLDRGELDKIIERSETVTFRTAQVTSRKRNDDDDDDERDSKKHKLKHRQEGERRKKDRGQAKSAGKPAYYKKSRKHASFIKELFDF